MELSRKGSRTASQGTPDHFTGSVRFEPLAESKAPARVQAALVTFQPGARSNWHTHPLGQTLIVLGGTGRVQSEGGPVREIREGDVVLAAPGEKHWHGAGPTTELTHLAVHEALNGTAITWLEKVRDDQYGGAVGARD